MQNNRNLPAKSFSVFSSISVIVGIVVGIGVFSFPAMIANNSDDAFQYILYWIAGGVITIMGGFCYSELTLNIPGQGGEYQFLKSSYSPLVGFLFLWGRTFLLQTGSIAVIAYIFGDYASVFHDFGPNSPYIYGLGMICMLTIINIIGTRFSINTQNLLTSAIIITVVVLAVGAVLYDTGESMPKFTNSSELSLGQNSSMGLAMIFVLLTFGGWNEASYISEEIIDLRKNVWRIYSYGITTITLLYLFINFAYIKILGFEGIKSSSTIGYDLAEKLFGSGGSYIVAGLIVVSALSTANASILTGARTNYILGKEYPVFQKLGLWNHKTNSPVNALIFQLIICFVLISLGNLTGKTISTVVDFTAPVFWLFMVLITFSVFISRRRGKNDSSYFTMPLYPIPPILFISACIYLFYSSTAYTGLYALAGLALLASGVPVWYLMKRVNNGKLKV